MCKKNICRIFGAGKVLPRYVLPTLEDVLKFHLYLNTHLGIYQVTDAVINCWKTIGIPIVSVQSVKRQLLNHWKKYRFMLKNSNRFKNPNSEYKVKNYKLESSKLFDIAKCKCVHKCRCPENIRVSDKLFDFLQDQRTTRIQKFESSMKSIQKSNVVEEDLVEEMEVDCNENEIESCDDKEDEFVEDVLWEPSNKYNKSRTIKSIKLKATAIVCDRYGISNRAGAALATAVLEDFKIVNSNDKHFVIDHKKLFRARKTNRQHIRSNSKVTSFNGLFFDGRKDRTLQTTINENIRRTSVIKEEHISVLGEPGSKYIGHISPISSSSKNVTTNILTFLNDENVSKDFQGVGTDGTNVNTGWKQGIIQLIEKRLERPLQWLICLLHFNELPLRRLFSYLDGPTCGPRAFKGPIGRQLKNSTKLKVVKFKRIPCTLPLMPDDISTDQKYLYNMCLAISKGKCSKSLAMNHPGNLCHSRWLTTANNILRIYIGTRKPSKNLVILTKYIINVYAPAWFTIKKNSKCFNGATNLYTIIASSRYLPESLRRVIDPVLQRNAFFAHPENILSSMLCDDRTEVRKLAVQRILTARSAPKEKVRVFRVPQVNFNAKDYTQMIDWDKVTITEPPLTSRISEKELHSISENKKKIDSFNLPCHTQATERCVKLVTEASMKVVGADNRDGYIRATLMSRSIMPQFNSKKHYATHNNKY